MFDIENLRANVKNGGLSNVKYRISLLKNLKKEIEKSEISIMNAIKADFNKCGFDSFITEIGMVYEEIGYFIKNLKRLSRAKRVHTSLKNFPSHGKIIPSPYGVVLIISPWNYPFLLAMSPLVGAVAAGNAVVLKPASATKNTSEVMKSIIEKVFKADEARVMLLNREQSEERINTRFDYIFFTGSKHTGKTIMRAASEHLTPVSLELGGKSPCVIDKTANINLTARRLAWGKFLNGGQTCVAPDYVLLHKAIENEFKAAIIKEIKSMYYEGDKLSDNFPYLISLKKADEMREVLFDAKILFGGKIDGRIMEPTVIECNLEHKCMDDEIFAPLLPIITVDDIDSAVKYINSHEKPLAMYYFGADKSIMEKCDFGGGCVYDTITHVSEMNLPFGGVGQSGIGRYHAKASFDTFTHYKSVLIKGKMDIPLRYKKTDKSLKTIKHIVK